MSNDDLSFLFGIKSTTITEVTREHENYEYIFGDENSIEGDDPIVDEAVKEFDSLLPILNSTYKNDPNIQMYKEALAKLCGCYVQFSMSFENIINNIGKTLKNDKLKQIYDMLLPKIKQDSATIEYVNKCRKAFANLFNLNDAELNLITNKIDDICSTIKNHDFVDFVKIDSLIKKNIYTYKQNNYELFNVFVRDYVNHLKETHEQSLNSLIDKLPNVENKDDIIIQYVKKHLDIRNEYELIGALHNYLKDIINKTHPKYVYVRALSEDPKLNYFKNILEGINNEDVFLLPENELDLFKYLDGYDKSKILPALFLTLTHKEQKTLSDLGIDTARKILLRVKDKEIMRAHLKRLLDIDINVLNKINWDNNNLKEWEYIFKRPQYVDVIKQRKTESFQESNDDNKSEEDEIKNKIKASKDSLRNFYKNQKDLERQETDEIIKAKIASENEIKNKELHDFDYKIERIIKLDNNNGYKYRNAIHYLLDNVEGAKEEKKREVSKFILDRLKEFTPEEILSVTKAYNKTLESTINILQVFYPIGKIFNGEFDPKFPLEPLFSNYELKQFSLGREIFKDFFYLTETQLNCFRKCITDANGNKEDEDLFVEQYFELLNETGINIEQNDKLINVTNYELAMAFVNSSSEAKINFINELHSAENSSNKNYKFAEIIQKYLMPNISFKDPSKTTTNTIFNNKSNDNTNVSKELDVNDETDRMVNKELDYSKLFTFLKDEGLLSQFISLIKDSGINAEATETYYDDDIDLFSTDLQLLIKHKNLNNRYISYFLNMNDEKSLFAIAVLLFSKNSKMEIDTQKLDDFYKEYINLKTNNQDNKSNQNIFDEVTDSINKDIDYTLFKLLKTSNTYAKTFAILSKGNIQIDENLIFGSRRFKNLCYNLFKKPNVKIDNKLFDIIKNADSFKQFLEEDKTKEKLKKYFKVDDDEIFNKLMSMDKSMFNSKEYIGFFDCIDLNMFNNAIDNILNSYPDNISNKIIDKINFANVINNNYIKVIACLLSDNQYNIMHIVDDEPDSMQITLKILSDQIDYTKNKEDSEEKSNVIVNAKNTLNNILDTIIDKLNEIYNHNDLQKFYNKQNKLSDNFKQTDEDSDASLINIISDINSNLDSKIEDIAKVDIFDLNDKRARKALSYTYNIINDKEQTDKNFLNDDRFLKDFISKHPNVYDIDALNAIYNLKNNYKKLVMIPKEYLNNLNKSIKDIINENDLIKNMTIEDYLKDKEIKFDLNYDVLKNIDITSIIKDHYNDLNDNFKKNIDEINKEFINKKSNIEKEIKEIILQINALNKENDKDKQNKIEELKDKRRDLINKKKNMQLNMQSTIINNINFDNIVEINDILNDEILELEDSGTSLNNNKDLQNKLKKLKQTVNVLTKEIDDYNEKNKKLTTKLTSEFNDKKDHNNRDGNSLETFSTIIQMQNFPAKFKEYEKTINEVNNDNINKILEILNINEKEINNLKLHIMKAREENDKKSIRQYINELNEKLKNKFITIKDDIITNAEKDCLDSFNKLSDIINETLKRFSDSTNSKKFPNSQFLKNFIEKENSLFLKLRTQFDNALLERTSIANNLYKQNLTDLTNSCQQNLASVIDSLSNCKLQLENLKTSLEKQQKNN